MEYHKMEQTVLGIQAGNRAAMEVLWTQLQPEVRRQALRWARVLGKRRPHVTAEDLYQCGYLALDRAVREYAPGKKRPFDGWFLLCLRLEFAREAGHRAVRVLDAAEGENRYTALDSAVSDALGALPEPLQNMLKLRYWFGLTVQEAGILLGLSPQKAAEAERRGAGASADGTAEAAAGGDLFRAFGGRTEPLSLHRDRAGFSCPVPIL